MNRQRALTVVLLACSVFVLGTMATSLNATVTSTPDDAIDVDTDSLPFMGDDASDIADSYKQAEEGEPSSPAPSDGADSPPSASGGGGGSDYQYPSDSPLNDLQSSAGDAGPTQGSLGGEGSSQSGTGPGIQDALWAFLEWLLAWLLRLAALAVLLAAAIFLFRRRDRILARIREFLPEPAEDATGEPTARAPAEPSGPIERAWGEMLRRSGADPPAGATPRECARAVIETGADREPVEDLTGLYEAVRYGGRPTTSADADRARDWLGAITPHGSSVALDGGQPSPDGSTVSTDGGAAVPDDRDGSPATSEDR